MVQLLPRIWLLWYFAPHCEHLYDQSCQITGPNGDIKGHYELSTEDVLDTESFTAMRRKSHENQFQITRFLCQILHWKGDDFILVKFSSLAALEVVRMTTSSATSGENFIKIKTFPFQLTKCIFHVVFCITQITLASSHTSYHHINS